MEDKTKMLFRKKLCYQCVSKRQNAKSCSDRKICRACNGKHPTTLNCSKEGSGKKPEEIASAENLKEDNKISSASVNSVNMGSNVINMSDVLLKLDMTEQIKFFIPTLCLKIAAKVHLQQKILSKNWE